MVYGFQHDKNLADQVDIIYDIPAEGEIRLRNDLIDIALIPSIEFANNYTDYELIPAGCIASDGAVDSVLLFFKENLEEIKTIALDTSSRTSVALLKLIMSEKFNIEPEYISMKPNIHEMLEKADAALLIGDNALKAQEQNIHFLDLGDEWFDMTGLPFVYAVWAGKRGKVVQTDLELLDNSRRIGLENIDKIATEEYTLTKSHSVEFYKNYLTDRIQFDLTAERLAGLKEYFQMAYMHGILKDIPEVVVFGEKKEA